VRSLLSAALALAILASAGLSHAGVIFDTGEGRVIAPNASISGSPDTWRVGEDEGWKANRDEDFYAFDAGVLNRAQGKLEIKLVVTDPAVLSSLGNDLEALFTIYDKDETPFFAVGINDHDVMVGSYPLHPMLMENAFGGVGFPYLAKIDGPLKHGTKVTITVTWGRRPADDKVFVNGKFVEARDRKGPRNKGMPPGFEPTATFSSFLSGFSYNYKVIGPPKTLTIGRMGRVDPKNRLSMYPPRGVAIKSVSISARPDQM
jgi:hypothetical protein